MQRPLALLVEDRVGLNQAKAEAFHAAGLAVLRATSLEEAWWQVRTAPQVELIICDINLDESDEHDKSGFEFAERVKAIHPDAIIIGYSGQFEKRNLPWSARAKRIFWRMYPRGRHNDLMNDLPEMIEEVKRRFDTQKLAEYEKLADFIEIIGSNSRWSKSESLAFRKFIPKALLGHTADASLDLTAEKALADAGYRLMLIPGEQDGKEGFGQQFAPPLHLQMALPLWVRSMSESVRVEVFRFPQFSIVAKSLDEAVGALIGRIKKAANAGRMATEYDDRHKKLAAYLMASS